MATSAERMRALRERRHRGLRKLRIQVSEDDLMKLLAYVKTLTRPATPPAPTAAATQTGPQS